MNSNRFSVYLRPFYEDDYLIINKWRNSLEIQKNVVGPMRFVSPQIERKWVMDRIQDNVKSIYLAICLNDGSDRMVGYISINDIDYLNRKAKMGGVVIGEKDCQDGVAALESFYILMEYAFSQLNMNRLSGSCLSDHPFSPYLLLSMGFQKEGVSRKYVYKNGSYRDVEFYSILKSDYEDRLRDGKYNLPFLIKEIVGLKKNQKKNGQK